MHTASQTTCTCRLVRLFAITLVASVLALGASGCGRFEEEANAQFGDQNFKSAISLIELHNVRFGGYPATLAELKFTGAWDQNFLSGVEYKRLDDGYELNLTRGWVGTPTLEYPAEFWQGIGLRRSNVKRSGGER